MVGEIGHGLVVLVGSAADDDGATIDKLAMKTAQLRIFNDDDGKFNRSLLDVDGEALVVSQFTLFADCRKGRRPNFTQAGPPAAAEKAVDRFAQQLREAGVKHVATGRFGASMHVEIQNDGPVTIWLDSETL